MTAAMGVNTSCIEDPRVRRKGRPDCTNTAANASFAVTQSLVSLLSETGKATAAKTPETTAKGKAGRPEGVVCDSC